MGTILSRVSINKKHVASLLVLMLVSSITEMMLPTLLASMIDRGIAEASRSLIVVTAVTMAVMAAVTCVASIVTTVLSAKISTRFAADLRKQIFYKV